MSFNFDYSEEKDAVLEQVRGVGFKDVITAIQKGGILDDIDHFNRKKYPEQKILIIRIENKVYAIPHVTDKVRKVKFLKTIYPSRKLRKKYLK